MKPSIRYVFPLVMVAAIAAILCPRCSQRERNQKIKLDSAAIRRTTGNAELATTLQVQPENRRSIAVFHFDNVTGDPDLDWMRRGLTQMLVTDLSQSRYVDLVNQQDLAAIMERMGVAVEDPINPSLAVSVAKEARVETALVGNFVKVGETIRIDAHLYDAQTGSLLKADRVEGEGLEQVFTMVDELSRRVRDGLKPTLKGVVDSDKGLAEVTTSSIEAYRFFAEGLEREEKILHEMAAEYFDRAVTIDTTFATAYLHLARAYINLARMDDARRAVAKAVAYSDYVTERERLTILSLDARLKGDYFKRVEIDERIVELFPTDKEARFYLGKVYEDLGRTDEAIAQYEAALKIDPMYKLVYNQLGYSYSSLGMHEKAVEMLRRYIELAPDEPNPHDSSGEIYQRAGRLDEAIDAFKQALEIDPDLYFPWVHLGLAYQDKGEFDKALSCFERFVELAPSEGYTSNGYRFMAEIHCAKGQYEEALKSYRQALEVYPNGFSTVSDIKELHEDRGDTVGAEAFCEEWFRRAGERVMEENSFDAVIRFVGTCIYEDIHIDELEPFIEKAGELAENDRTRAACTEARALIRLKQGDIDSALALWWTVLDLPPVVHKTGVSSHAARLFAEAIASGSGDPAKGNAFLEELIGMARDMDNSARETGFRYFLFESYRQSGDDRSLERELMATGTPQESDWWVIGPFENEDGFRNRFPPERETKLTRSYTRRKEKVRWRQAEDGVFDGFISLKEIFDPDTWVVAYGLLSVESPTTRQAHFRVGTDDGVKIWLNGEEVWARNVRRSAVTDDDLVPVELKGGTNTVLIKVCQTISDWGFFFRITDPEGHPFGDIAFLPQVVS